jgi:hypothetical protein
MYAGQVGFSVVVQPGEDEGGEFPHVPVEQQDGKT